MGNVLIVVYLLIVLALIAVILLQRSEGGALGMGGGGGNNGLASTRSAANLLTRTTAILAALFFATAIGLTVINSVDNGSQSILDSAVGADGEAPNSVLDALNSLSADEGLAVPETAPVADDAPDLAVPGAEAPTDGAATSN